MTLKIRVSTIKYALLYSLLFLAAMNFQAKFFYFVFATFLVVLVSKTRLRIDRASFLYFFVCCMMALYNNKEGLISMLRCLAHFCFFLVGLNFVTEDGVPEEKTALLEKVEKRGLWLLAVISTGSFTHYGLNFFYNFGRSLGRNTNDIWTGQRMAATGQNALACLMLGFSVAMLILPGKKWHRLAAICAIALMLGYNMVLSTRTMIVMLLILVVVGFGFLQKGLRRGQRTKAFVAVVLFALLAVIAYLLDIGGIQEYIKDSSLYGRFRGYGIFSWDETSRLYAKVQFLKNMYKYPFGGMHSRARYGYAHDLLLDGYDEYGIVVFLLLIAILIHGGVQLYRTLKRTGYSFRFKLSLLLVYAAILLEFTIEPILPGMQWLFACYCLINGCITAMNRVDSRCRKRSMRSPNESLAD